MYHRLAQRCTGGPRKFLRKLGLSKLGQPSRLRHHQHLVGRQQLAGRPKRLATHLGELMVQPPARHVMRHGLDFIQVNPHGRCTFEGDADFTAHGGLQMGLNNLIIHDIALDAQFSDTRQRNCQMKII